MPETILNFNQTGTLGTARLQAQRRNLHYLFVGAWIP
jgi:hypothetical protein